MMISELGETTLIGTGAAPQSIGGIGGRVALLHPWFLALGGAEQTVEGLAVAFPEASLMSLLYEKRDLPESLREKKIGALSINWLPGKVSFYRPLLPVWPAAVETLDLRGYKLVITSDSNVMKGVLVDQQAIHICYCHSPMRVLWDLHSEYRAATPWLVRSIFDIGTSYLRQWDFQAAQRVDYFIANSRNVQQRIRKYYRRDSTVIYPPVDTAKGYISGAPDSYYLSVGRLTATKRIDLLIQACNRLRRRLIVAGAGRELARLKLLAGPTIEFLGRVPDADLAKLYANCRAFLFAADEDFGIVPVEAQSFGRPVIAYGYGGSLETVRVNDLDGRTDTGVFFREQTVESLVRGIERFESAEHNFVPAEIQDHARQFAAEVFVSKIRQFADSALQRERLS
jgi:glycosyltransferase involved in cell wall biosynthesis